jgi:DNA-directed RNA polymerase specialized sigma subunit
MAEDRKARDLELFHNWKSSGSKKDLGVLLDQLSPVIYNEVRNQSGSLPTAALSAEAKKWTYKALQTFDPNRGVALATHVSNYLPNVRRLNYRLQNAVRLPENMQLKYNEYNKSLQDLTDLYNREPTEAEMAERLGWTKPQVIKYKNSLYADLIESASARPSETTQFNWGSILMEHLMNQLSPEEKFILENTKTLSSTELAAKLGVNINRLNYLKAKLTTKIKDIQKDMQM